MYRLGYTYLRTYNKLNRLFSNFKIFFDEDPNIGNDVPILVDTSMYV